MKILRSLYEAVRSSGYSSKAFDAVENGDYRNALDNLERAEKSGSRGADIPILKGFVYLQLDRDQDCLDVLTDIFEKIDHPRIYSEQDKLYLKCYTSILAKRACDNLGTECDDHFDINYSGIKLENVSKVLREHFPLRTHPDWVEP